METMHSAQARPSHRCRRLANSLTRLEGSSEMRLWLRTLKKKKEREREGELECKRG